MAYGKIKADAIIYDNSGSDVEKTVVSLTTPEGTAVKSTGVNNTSNYLRTDGDGTCSWQTIPAGVGGATGADFNDNVKNRFGAGYDLSIWSDGSVGIIQGISGGSIHIGDADTENIIDVEPSQVVFNKNITSQDNDIDIRKSGASKILWDDSDTAIEFADDVSAIFGTGGDLNIAHFSSGNLSRIQNGGAGGLDIKTTAGNINFKCTAGGSEQTGAVYTPGAGWLFAHAGGTKLETSATGIAVTGNVTATDLTLSGDLTVSGTTTTVNTATLEVEDKNIELGKVSSPSDTTADGGGITLKGASDKTFNWVDATDAWTSSEHIALGDSKNLLLGTGSDLKIYHDGTNSKIENTTGTLYLQPKTGEEGINIVPDGAVNLYYDNAKKLETTNTGVYVGGSVTDSKGDVRTVTLNINTSAYTLVASDAGKCVTNTSGGWTVNNNIFTAGQVVTFINNSGSDQTITQGSGVTIYNTADAATGNRTLAQRGMATLIFYNASTAYISGAGLS